MNIYYIDVTRKKRNTAGMKAPQDISELCNKWGMQRFSMPAFPSNKSRFYEKIWLFAVCSYYWVKLSWNVTQDSIVLYQHPMYGIRVAEQFIPRIQRRKNCKFIAVIHDLESLRGGISGVISQNQKTSGLADNTLLKHFDAVICHNDRMKFYLVNKGFEEDRLVGLEIFDYLSDCYRVQLIKGERPSIAIAGNLAIGKCPYIYEIFGEDGLQNSHLTAHLFGSNYDKEKAHSNMIYHGSFKPEELPEHLEGDFGLVWDGTSAETCAGNTGEYLKYNNPHKTSLYLASGMPVIVWRQAAIADFVLENGVGIAVDSLYGLDKVIANISDADYMIMCENVKKIGKRLREGYYFRNAMEKCLKTLSN